MRSVGGLGRPSRSWRLSGESFGPDLTPTEVARKHRISTGQIYTWRQQFLTCEAAVSRMAPRFTAVELAPPCAPSHPPLPEPPPPCPLPMQRRRGLRD